DRDGARRAAADADAGRARLRPLSWRARAADRAAPRPRPLDHPDPHRARHGHRAQRCAQRDDDARRPGDRRRHSGRDPGQPDRPRTVSGAPMTEPAAAPVAPAPTTMLEIAGLDAFYGKARVLDDLSFTM